MSNPLNPSHNNPHNPLTHSPLTDRRSETSKETEKKSTGGVKSHNSLAKMMEYSAQVNREEQERKMKNATSGHNPTQDAINHPDKQQPESS